MSDPTKQHSCLFQTGIEVILIAVPVAYGGSATHPKKVHLPRNSRLRYYEEEGEWCDRYSTAAITVGGSSSAGPTTSRRITPSPSYRGKTWRQQLACAMPTCGTSSSIVNYHSFGTSMDDALSLEEDPYILARGYNKLVGRCNPMEIQTGIPYWTEEDVSLVEYSNGDDSSDYSSESMSYN